MQLKLALVALAGAAVVGSPALAQTQGVTKDQIIIGSIQDLSGPVAGFGKQTKQGLQMRVDEVNEQGGVNGRKLVLKVEDAGYDPKRAVLAAQKLVNQDKIFAMIGHIGTAQNVASFPVLFEKNVINFFPLSAGREMYEPPNKLKYSYASTYYDQIRQAAPRLVQEKNAQKVCAVYQDDDYGLEVLRGAEAGLKAIGVTLIEKTSFKRGATDFSSQTARMKAAGCDFVVLGTLIRETIGVMGEARKTGFNPIFLMSSGAYSDVIHKLGGKAVEGLYATMTVQQPYLDDDSMAIRAWANKYKTKFNEDPGVHSVYGYIVMDAFVKAAQKAGPSLTTESFIQIMDSMTFPSDIFGTPVMTFSPTKRLGNDVSRISQIQDGRWKVVSDYMK
ncbi:MAG: ABC transporter substrate-binding protein [Desulfovibrionaceae bacterium]|nr:ABC transporter substrate-binding protein [Desulfovibrionaceae bacterium]